METVKRPETKRCGVRPLIVATTLFSILPSCARIESFLSGARVADNVGLTASLAEGQGEPGRTDASTAHRALKEAYLAALRSRLWESMFEVGDSYSKIGDRENALRCFLIALYRARIEGSANGVLRVAESLAVLGEREFAAQAVAIGQRLAEQKGDRRLPGPSAAEPLKAVN